jgi:trypsin inhibitor
MQKLFSATVVIVLGLFAFAGCSMSPQYAYAVKTADYGQCRSLIKGERIRYKKRPVSFICEENHILYGKPYKSSDTWYFKSGIYDGKKVKEASPTRVVKTLRNICQIQGSYGTGTEKIRMFYFNTKLQRCMPFEWSGKGGMAPFDSQDICEMNCYY